MSNWSRQNYSEKVPVYYLFYQHYKYLLDITNTHHNLISGFPYEANVICQEGLLDIKRKVLKYLHKREQIYE